MERRSDALVDVMRVPVDGDPTVAVVPVGNLADARVIECDVLVVGGGTGGVAAALAAARRGRRVHLIEETDWIGGQLTAQGVSALDEHEHIEAFGGTASYYQLRNALRDHYRPLAGEAGKQPHFNPGNCWVTRVAFEPKVAVAAMMALLQPHIDAGRLTLHLRAKAAAAEVKDDRIVSVTAIGLERRRRAPVSARHGARRDRARRSAAARRRRVRASAPRPSPRPASRMPSRPSRKPHCVQSFTYVFGLERRPQGERHVIARPARYEFFRAAQPYSLTHRGARRRDLRRGERLAQLQGASRPCPAPRAGCGPIAA